MTTLSLFPSKEVEQVRTHSERLAAAEGNTMLANSWHLRVRNPRGRYLHERLERKVPLFAQQLFDEEMARRPDYFAGKPADWAQRRPAPRPQLTPDGRIPNVPHHSDINRNTRRKVHTLVLAFPAARAIQALPIEQRQPLVRIIDPR